MRRIISKGEEEKKEKRKRRIIGISLLLIMVISVFGIIVDSIGVSKNTSGKITYKGTDFFIQQDRWFFVQNGVEFSILNSPEELVNITIPGDVATISSYSQLPLYIYSQDKSLESEITYNLNKFSNRIQQGCLNDTFCNGDYPIKTCEDKFILLLEGNETSVVQNQSCVFITAPETKEMQRLLDAFFLKITGIN